MSTPGSPSTIGSRASAVSGTSTIGAPPSKSKVSKAGRRAGRGAKRASGIPGARGKKSRARDHKKPFHRRRAYSFRVFIYRVMKNRSSNKSMGVSSAAMAILNSFVIDMIERVGDQASFLCHYEGKRTVTESDIISALKLVIPYDDKLTPSIVSAASKAAASLRGRVAKVGK